MIYLVIDGRELMINENDSYDIKMFSTSITPKWYQLAIQTRTTGYKSININNKQIYIHRLIYHAHNQDFDIFDISRNNLIDHINCDRGDNNISNLRVVTNQQNQFNTRAKGYTWHKTNKKWKAQIQINTKRIHLGHFDTEEEARNAYLEAKKKYHIIPQLVSKS